MTHPLPAAATALPDDSDGGAAMARKARLMRMATGAATAMAAVLITIKLVAWVVTGSVAVLSTLIDSILDIGASMLTFLAVTYALRPADREHRFGHGKAEPLAGLAQAAFVAGSVVLLLFEAVDRLVRPQPISNDLVGIAVMVASIVLTGALVAYQRYVIAATRSTAVSGDYLHYAGDVLWNVAVLASLAGSWWLGWTFIDPLGAAVIAVYLLLSAYRIARGALDGLLDRELPEQDRVRIRGLAKAHADVLEVHDLRTRTSGPTAFIQLHLEMDGALPLLRAHAVADAVEAEIRAAFPHAEVIIHQDPAGIEEPPRLR